MKKSTGQAAERLGRPRLFDDETERRMVMNAAVTVMNRNGYSAMSVADVLAEANLSTSSFYRHFASKDALAEALIRRDGRSARRFLDAAIDAAPDPVAAFHAWLDALLDLFFQPGRAERTSLLSAADVLGSRRAAEVTDEMRWLLAEPLVDLLRAGHAAGVLDSAHPEADAVSLFALASQISFSEHGFAGNRDETRAQVMRFAAPALRIPDPGARRKSSRSRQPGKKHAS
ncbi:TetR/AcrR family transcriptional regulator [Mycobacterium sp. Y57]|uniref:TetR/AcrR family transcriptional regulator n=1 Tax=Mycolicibacterium xanthum TaxID=2796469 RepID=UPI001C84BD77|nr:TetR/AcrR family transcriptional regulator [Mycolicibacterium xanthum]MBX7434205.1 TetR/AcrR family transcriptional regulator [Mycolicibacterium xanthum]